jgi:hypothetical protein
MIKKRIQLTLFIDEDKSEAIENIRKKFNPLQFDLIKSHVTLCREDELKPIEQVIQNLEMLSHGCISIAFGPVTKFSDNKGVLIPSTGENDAFQQLRKLILKGVITNPRRHEPHITLLHPRNSTCSDSLFQQIEKIKLPDRIAFKMISLIAQEGESKWNILEEYALKDRV